MATLNLSKEQVELVNSLLSGKLSTPVNLFSAGDSFREGNCLAAMTDTAAAVVDLLDMMQVLKKAIPGLNIAVDFTSLIDKGTDIAN